MVIGNATGCSSIWGGSAPAIPYCVNKDGFGPTWGNSLFEDPAEFTYGMLLGAIQQRKQLADLVTEAVAADIDGDLKTAMQGWLDNMKDAEGSRQYGDELKKLLPAHKDNALLAEVYLKAHHISGKDFYKSVAFETIDFMMEKMSEDGLFYSASDADTEGEEGKYFVYTYEKALKSFGKAGITS